MFDWLRRRNELARRFVEVVRAVDPGVEARIVSRHAVELRGEDGARCICSLESLAAGSALPGGIGDDDIRRHVATALRTLRPLPATVELDRVLALVKPAGWAEGACDDARERPLVRHVAKGLEAVVVEEIDGCLRFVAERHLQASALAAPALHEAAIANLEAQAAAASIAATDEAGILLVNLAARPSFNATLALLPSIWRRAEAMFDGDALVCAMPERDFCLFARATDAAAVGTLCDDLAPSLFDGGAYPLSRTLWRLVDGRLDPLPADGHACIG